MQVFSPAISWPYYFILDFKPLFFSVCKIKSFTLRFKVLSVC
jgi:hypothetical protein